ncbi:hypothetical protein E8E14_000784 [Neopestalotiopsis sp. 37M]|nr:hypothetical protein E8E14_000784 [Neopestalotiopsis sp. 37M]
MDPASALGIAAAVVQFVDFATRRCRDILKIYETGDTTFIRGAVFEHTARDFLDFSADLRNPQNVGSITHVDHQMTDDAIKQLVASCSSVAHEIATIFQKLDGLRQSKQPGSKIVALIKASWKYDDITRLMEKMAACHTQLVLRMLQKLNSATEDMRKINRQRFDSLDHQYSEITRVLAVMNNRLDGMKIQDAALRRRLDETDLRGTGQHDRILSAILTLKNGTTRVIAPKGAYQLDFEDHGQSLMTLSIKDHNSKGHVELRKFEPIQNMVLESLYFRHYRDRYDSVKPAHASTFKWILEDTRDTERPWPSLLHWLESGSGCYWISGKAGSGKSTLMKYILDNPKTQEAIEEWSKSCEGQAALASFFFWNLGSAIPKSQEGLLRSLMYDILSRHPGVIASVVLELRILNADSSRGDLLGALSFPELLRWFKRLLDQTSSQFHLFFLLDGIDEYEGDEIEILNLLTAANHYQYVKVLVSSRPMPACVDAFSSFPHLKLQDLTRDDIRDYTVSLLRQRLESRYGEEWETFVEAVVEKSCGVFLWVVLVVRSLLTGLQNFDDITELRHRLDEFPSELKDLYAAIGTYHITPVQLHFAGWDVATIIGTPVRTPTVNEEKIFVEITEGRIRARCAGILELHSVDYKRKGFLGLRSVKHHYVDFIHRTAVEFLKLPEIWEKVSLLTTGTEFHPATLPQCTTQGSDDGRLASRLLFDATESMLFRRPWEGTSEHRERMRLTCPAICSLLLEKGADPNAQFHTPRESAWGLMIEYALTHRPRRAEFWRNFGFRGFAYAYSHLLLNFVLNGSDVNAEIATQQRPGMDLLRSQRVTYPALKAVEALYTLEGLEDHFALSWQPSQRQDSRSEELISFYKNLHGLMVQKGAVKDLGGTAQSQKNDTFQRNQYSTNSALAPPDAPSRPRSTGSMRSKLKDMFGKPNYLKDL